MSDRLHPLKDIPPHAFSVMQASYEQFHRDLADIPERYPDGVCTYLASTSGEPYFIVPERYQDRVRYVQVQSFEELISAVEDDRSMILFISYSSLLFGVDDPARSARFCEVCKVRATNRGPVVVLTAYMDRTLLEMDGVADYFFQIGKVKLSGMRLRIREQKTLDDRSWYQGCQEVRGRMYGQIKLEW
ncbi:MAG TPA: hypothetical protein VN372_15315 [Methanospirillum sp.]|nr:hypothetical protein [Methanospirillum sp.]